MMQARRIDLGFRHKIQIVWCTVIKNCLCLQHGARGNVNSFGSGVCRCVGWGKLTSGTQEAPSHVDGGGEEAVLLGAAVVAADHDVVSKDDTACRHAAVAGVIGQRTADTTNQTTWRGNRWEREQILPQSWYKFAFMSLALWRSPRRSRKND